MDDNDFFCLRGLETYQSRYIHTEIHTHRAMHRQIIMNEQNRQSKLLLPINFEIFRKKVKHLSELSLFRAHQAALHDKQEAQSIHFNLPKTIFRNKKHKTFFNTSTIDMNPSITKFTNGCRYFPTLNEIQNVKLLNARLLVLCEKL